MAKSEERQDTLTEAHIQQLRDIINKIKYGSITLVIQDGELVQIDVNEKFRLK